MPTRNYTIQFDSDAAKLIANLTQLIQLMNQLHQSTRAANNALNQMPNLQPHARHAETLADRLGKVASQAAGMLGVKQALDAIGDGLKGARDEAEKMGEKSFSDRDKAREYANLLGETGPNDKVMGSLYALGTASAKTFDEANAFGREFLGAIPAAQRKGKVRDRDIQAIAAEGALFGTRVGLDDVTAGRLAGLIPGYINLVTDDNGKPLNPQQVLERFSGQLGAMGFGLNEGVGQISSLAKAELKGVLPAMASGRVRDFAEGAAFIGVASQVSPEGRGAGTRFMELERLLFETSGPLAKFLKENGIDQEPTVYGRMAKLKAVLDEKVGPGGDVKTFLSSHGARNEEEVAAGAFYYANFGLLTTERDEARRRTERGDEAMALNRAYTQDPNFQERQARTRGGWSQMKVGSVMQRLMIGRANALARMQGLGMTADVRQRVTNELLEFGGIRNRLGVPTELEKDIDDEYLRILEIEAKNKDVDLEKEGIMHKDWRGRRSFRHELDPLRLGQDINALQTKYGMNVFGVAANQDYEMRAWASGKASSLHPDNVPSAVQTQTASGPSTLRVESPDVKEAAGTIQSAGNKMASAASELLRWLTSPPGHAGYDGPKRN